MTIEGFEFMPATVEVAAGGVVRWRNRDGEPHSIRADVGSIASPLIVDDAFEWVAEGPADRTVSYFCGVHPGMRGSIEVH